MGKLKSFSFGKARSVLYRSAKILGDVSAIKDGKLVSRGSNRVVGKVSGRISRRISNSLISLVKK